MTTAVVLDLDDTLYLEEAYVLSGIAWLSDWLEREWGIRGFRAIAETLREMGIRDRLFNHSLAKLGITPAKAFIDLLVEQYRSHPPTISLAIDAEAFLAANHGLALALITDGHAVSQRAKIAALGLERFDIQPMICTGDWGPDYWKPHLRAFEAVEAHYRGVCEAFVYVADNPAKDFLAPRRLGWRTIQIDRPGAIHSRVPPSAEHRADLRIHSFDELLPSRIEQLRGRSATRG